MLKKKGNEEQEPEHENVEPAGFPTTVMCPNHNLPLQIQTENREIGGKTVFVRFAVCNCMVADNTTAGKRVWEQT